MNRWRLAADMNLDGLFTITDVWLLAKFAFFLPGDMLVALLLRSESIATFMELSLNSYSGWGAGIVSSLIWLSMLTIRD